MSLDFIFVHSFLSACGSSRFKTSKRKLHQTQCEKQVPERNYERKKLLYVLYIEFRKHRPFLISPQRHKGASIARFLPIASHSASLLRTKAFLRERARARARASCLSRSLPSSKPETLLNSFSPRAYDIARLRFRECRRTTRNLRERLQDSRQQSRVIFGSNECISGSEVSSSRICVMHAGWKREERSSPAIASHENTSMASADIDRAVGSKQT